MINRFTSIKGVGRFLKCDNIGGHQLGKNTIIFGQNTGGKSTLTDILWSFKNGNPAIIEGRKTFGYNGIQHVKFVDDNGTAFEFPSAAWNSGSADIEIFDTHFINDNIFEGEEINFDHQQNLHSIIIGPDGKQLAQQVAQLKSELDALTSKKSARTTEFNRAFGHQIALEEFENLPKVNGVQSEIKKLQTKLEVLLKEDEIKKAFEEVEQIIKNILSQRTKDVLSQRIVVDAELIEEHVRRTWKDPTHSKDFLQTGLTLTKNDHRHCVFCGQSMNDSAKSLLTAYAQAFNKEYTEARRAANAAAQVFDRWNPDDSLERCRDRLATVNVELTISDCQEELKHLKDAAAAEFHKKVKDLAYEIDFSSYDNALGMIRVIHGRVSALKSKFSPSADATESKLKNEIARLEISKKRHTKEWEEFFDESKRINELQATKKEQREALRDRLAEYSEKLFSVHLDSINNILEELKADFQICDFQPIRRIIGQRERIFALKFFQRHRVAIDETETNRPNFKNTLSESDKRVLAFAFFYSLMIHDDRLAEKIIVFDDPFSSFDADRRSRTSQLLANPHIVNDAGELVGKSINQLIVLTHEEEFFKWMYQKLDSPRALKIVPAGIENGVKKSTIEICDVEREFIEDKSTKDLKEIRSIYDGHMPITNYEELCVKCRKILESVFTTKYLFELEDDIKAKRSVRTFVETLSRLSVGGFNNQARKKEFMFLCDNLNIELHNTGLTNAGGNAQDVLRDFLKLVRLI
jgi:wobble nucleotide-excising tRNase